MSLLSPLTVSTPDCSDGWRTRHVPVNLGARFSKNASLPSRTSSVRSDNRWYHDRRFERAERKLLQHRVQQLVRAKKPGQRWPVGELLCKFVNCAVEASSPGTLRLIMPNSAASLPVIGSPSISISFTASETDEQWKERHATVARGDAVLHMAVAETGVVGGDDEVAGRRDVHAQSVPRGRAPSRSSGSRSRGCARSGRGCPWPRPSTGRASSPASRVRRASRSRPEQKASPSPASTTTRMSTSASMSQPQAVQVARDAHVDHVLLGRVRDRGPQDGAVHPQEDVLVAVEIDRGHERESRTVAQRIAASASTTNRRRQKG